MAVRNKIQTKKRFTSNMLNRTLRMFKYNDLPETIPQNELEKLLQENGFAVIAKANGDLFAFNATLGGENDPYGRPTTAIVSNPALKFNETLTIGKDCVVIYNDYYKQGIKSMIDDTAQIIAEADISLVMTLINKRAQTMISASDDQTIESARAYIKKLIDGDLEVISDSQLFESLRAQDISGRQAGTLKDIYETIQYELATLYNNLGLNSNFNMKRERLITSEIEANNDILFPLVESYLEAREIGLDEVNEIFETSITVEFTSVWKVKQQIQEEEIDLTSEETEEELNAGESEQTDNAATEETTETTNDNETSNEETEPETEQGSIDQSESESLPTDEEVIEAQEEEIADLQEQVEELEQELEE